MLRSTTARFYVSVYVSTLEDTKKENKLHFMKNYFWQEGNTAIPEGNQIENTNTTNTWHRSWVTMEKKRMPPKLQQPNST